LLLNTQLVHFRQHLQISTHNKKQAPAAPTRSNPGAGRKQW
jgi:hypothetical protein